MQELIQLPSKLRIELELTQPNDRDTGRSDGNNLAILLHPWSWLGGNMNDPVLQHLCGVFTDRGYHVIRYNSRGVGKSSGWASFSGQQETKDLQEVVQWSLAHIGNVDRLVIAGYSYGSLISSCYPLTSPPLKTAHLILSYPLDKRGLLTLFHSNFYSSALSILLKETSSRVLIVYGDQDEFTSAQSYTNWVEQLRDDAGGGQNLRVETVRGASHFWAASRRDMETLLQVVDNWLTQWTN